MSESFDRMAWSPGRKSAISSVAIVIMLVLVSAAAMIVSSEGLLPERTGVAQGGADAQLTILSVSASPTEAYVDQFVEWTVVVELQGQSHRGKGLLFTWDWDDGTYNVNHLKSVNSSDIAIDVETHAWAEPGIYDVEVSVWDGYGNENSRLHNVSSTVPFIVSEEVTSRSVDYCWYGMFSHPLGPWYEYREAYYGDEYVVTDSYPYLYVREREPIGNTQIYTFMRLTANATDIPEVNMNEKPELLPCLSGSDGARGGTAILDLYMNYPTMEECFGKLGTQVLDYYDGWITELNGTVTLDKQAAKSVLGITDSQFDTFATWWSSNQGTIESEWEEWLQYEGGNDRLAIYNAYEYWYDPLYTSVEAGKTVDDLIVLTIDFYSWGGEALMFRWLHESLMPTEWYMEDMNLHATIGPEMADVDIDAAVGYALTASETIEDGAPCWVWQAMLQDYMESSQYYPVSDFDPYADQDYLFRYPGNDWHGEMMPYDYTPGAWNLSAGETLTLQWPMGEQLFLVNDATGLGVGTVDGTLDCWSEMTVSHSEPMPDDAPGSVVIDTNGHMMTFIGPFDMWTWSRDQIAHSHLFDEWDRLGIMPYGMPYIEFRPTDEINTVPTARFTVDPQSGTVETVFEFDASSCWDLEDPVESLEVRWDWHSDGIWDTGWSTTEATQTRVFSIADTYEITLQVKDSGGLTSETSRTLVVEDLPSGHIPHDPIYIYGNDGFTSENGVIGGSGTPSDPFIIEGWEITAPISSGIHVENVDAWFVIRDVYVHSDSGNQYGILLISSTGGAIIERCVCEGFRTGIAAADSANLVVAENTCSGNSHAGIFVELCQDDVVISNNTCCGNGWGGGIYNNDSMDTLISGNYVYDNVAGISVAVFSQNVTVVENTVFSNDVGMRVLYVPTAYTGMDDISIYHNDIVDNDLQASDNSPEGIVSWDNGYPSGGNFWSDYEGEDLLSGPSQDIAGSDGIGDTAYVIDAVHSGRYPLYVVQEPTPSDVTYRIYDLFEEPWGPWWDYRVMAPTWDYERPLTTDAGEMTYLYSTLHNPLGNLNDQGLIYAPYRWNVTASDMPNVNIHEPVFMPVLGGTPMTGAEASVEIEFQYVYSQNDGPGGWWEDYWIPEWGEASDWEGGTLWETANSPGDWESDGEEWLNYQDGFFMATYYRVVMNRAAAEEWIGMPETADPNTWWPANKMAYILDWEEWIDHQGNDVYDIYCGYEWPYVAPGTMMRLDGDSDEVTLEIGHFSQGYEALMTRWLNAAQISVHQPWFEDFEMVVDYRENNIDVTMDAVCQWSLHCVKQNATDIGEGTPCAWAWEPIGLDCVAAFADHPSDYTPYYYLDYESWNCGDVNLGNMVAYECTPWEMDLLSCATLIIELPTGEVPGYYAETVPFDAIAAVWAGDTSDYDAIRYYGAMTPGYMDIDGASYEYFPGNNTLIIYGPADFENAREGGLLYHGAPWLEFNVMSLLGDEAGDGEGASLDSSPPPATQGLLSSATTSTAGELSSMAGMMIIVTVAAVVLSLGLSRKRGRC